MTESNENILDATTIEPRLKHPTIFARFDELKSGESFRLHNDHDPKPLRYQFEAEFTGAFSWEYLEQGPDEFRVKITKLQAVGGGAPKPAEAAASGAGAVTPVADDVREIDVRGFEPPEPLVRILDALESLPDGVKLRAHTDREPCHLFGEAEARGFSSDCNEQSDGSWITVLSRA